MRLEYMKGVQIDFNWWDPDRFCQWLYEHGPISLEIKQWMGVDVN